MNILKKLFKNLKNMRFDKGRRQKNKSLVMNIDFFSILDNLMESNKSKLTKDSYELLKVYNLVLKENDVLMYPRGNCVNMEAFARFFKNVNNNISDYVRIVAFGVEGQLVFQSIFFTNKSIKLVVIYRGALGTKNEPVIIKEYYGKSIGKTKTHSGIKYHLELENGERENLLYCFPAKFNKNSSTK